MVRPCTPYEAGLDGRVVAQAAAAPVGEASACAGSGRRAARAWNRAALTGSGGASACGGARQKLRAHERRHSALGWLKRRSEKN